MSKWPDGFVLTLWQCDYAITERETSTLWSPVLLADYGGTYLVYTLRYGAVMMYIPSLRYPVWTMHEYTHLDQLPRLRRSVPVSDDNPQERVWEPKPWLQNIIDQQLKQKGM